MAPWQVFDDFLYAAQYLVDHQYTSRGKLILNGGSNGGLLVGACTNQAEEGLIGASVADVGVMDLLKFHKWTIGHFWVSDYGCANEPKDFEYGRLFSSSALTRWLGPKGNSKL